MDTAKEIIESLPERFKPDTVDEGVNITYHFHIKGEDGGDFTVNLSHEACTVQEGIQGEAKCVVKTNAKTYRNVELGKTDAKMAFLMGKLKISNINSMLKFIECFERLH